MKWANGSHRPYWGRPERARHHTTVGRAAGKDPGFGKTLLRAGVLAVAGLWLQLPAQAAPHLLMSFPRDHGVYDSCPSPITFVFSEPMDPSSVVLPNRDDSNPNRSFDVFSEPGPGLLIPEQTGGQPAITRDGGQVVEIPGSSAFPGAGLVMHVYRRGFRSVKGEYLDHDYTIRAFGCDCLDASDDMTRASIPALGQWDADPDASFSVYLGNGVDPATSQATLTRGFLGPSVGPIAVHWDLPQPSLINYQPAFPGGTGFGHLTVDHPPLPPSARPYYLSLHAFTVPGPMGNPPATDLNGFDMPFTVGPALAGDLNGDGQVTVADGVLALRGALGLITLTPAQRFAADLRPPQGANGRSIGDGQVDVSDAVYILRRAVGLIRDEEWP